MNQISGFKHYSYYFHFQNNCSIRYACPALQCSICLYQIFFFCIFVNLISIYIRGGNSPFAMYISLRLVNHKYDTEWQDIKSKEMTPYINTHLCFYFATIFIGIFDCHYCKYVSVQNKLLFVKFLTFIDKFS